MNALSPYQIRVKLSSLENDILYFKDIRNMEMVDFIQEKIDLLKQLKPE